MNMSNQHLTLRTAYWDDAAARAAFKRFILEIFSLDFALWERHGYWDDAYCPFSYFSGEQIVASLCVYALEALVAGKPVRLAQISAVGTLPEWRRRGLCRQLTELALPRTAPRPDGIFLFASEMAHPLYTACGFTPLTDHLEQIRAEPMPARKGIVKLDPADPAQLSKVYRYARERCAVSQRFCVHNPQLLMFHALYTLPDQVYEIPELETLLFCDWEEDLLTVYDIVSPQPVPWVELYPWLATPDIRRVRFHFHTDLLALESVEILPRAGNHPFVLAPFPAPAPIFPFTSIA